MSFLYPYVLWALILPVLLAAAAVLRHRRAGSAWRKLVSPQHERELVTRRAPWHRALGGTLGIAALASLIIALARPINGYREAGATTATRNLLLALDISRSMETQDVSPSRLEEARAAAYELIDALPEDKIGLIVFSGEADLVVPLTYDHTALRDALEQVDRTWAGTGGTDFNRVLRKAMQDFERSAPDGTNALVLLSDGEDTTETGTSLAAEAKEKQLLVIAVGIGTEAGGAIPDPQGDNGLWQDADGKHVISKLNAESLRAFAAATGGDYVAMNSQTDLTAFAQRAVRKLAAHEEEVSINKVPNDLFAWPAGFSLLLLAASILAATDWRAARRRVSLAAAALLLLLPAAQAAPAPEALEQYRMGLNAIGSRDEEAKEFFSRALLDDDRDLQAAALYEIGNTNTRATFTRLRSLYETPESADDDPDTPADARRPGPTKKALQDIVDSLRQDTTSYDSALALRPGMKQAAANKAKVEELIRVLEEEIQREEPPSDPEQNQDDSSDEQQDEDNKDSQENQGENNSQQNGDGEQEGPPDSPQDNDRGDQGGDENKPQDAPQDENRDGEQNQPQKPEQGDTPPDEPHQDKGQEQQPQPNNAEEPQNGMDEQKQAAEAKNDKEKAEQRAASILQMHLDEEGGSPIPHSELPARPPRKDY